MEVTLKTTSYLCIIIIQDYIRASNRDFWGCIYVPGDLSNLVEDGFLSMTINSNPYWLHVYTADAVVCDCCNNLSGVWRPI